MRYDPVVKIIAMNSLGTRVLQSVTVFVLRVAVCVLSVAARRRSGSGDHHHAQPRHCVLQSVCGALQCVLQRFSVVKIIIISSHGSRFTTGAVAASTVTELEIPAKSTLLLQLLREHLILADIGITHRAPRKLHGLFEVHRRDLRHRVDILFLHAVIASRLTLALHTDALFDGLTNGILARTLADLSQISSREFCRGLRQLINGHILSER
mmetsp:Transcript_53710/g.45100  ORF Transcript_53710/g.45100 Transcript_53710/m.45100 type:complete len:210 (+) Transcript_53710:447-1076(+)